MASTDESPRHRVLLALISLLAAAPMVYFAVHQRIDYDGWWHIFIAREVQWARFWRDVYYNAHPPLYYLLLRGVTFLGFDRVVYRSLSIVAAVVATFVVGRIAARVFRSPAVSLLCALAFGFAMTTVVMAGAVRSYMVGTMLLLIAFRHYLDLLDPSLERIEPKTRVLFAVSLTGAVLTHYSAIFFFCAAMALPWLYAALDRQYRKGWRERLRARWTDEIATVGPVAAVVVAVYVAHVSRFAERLYHMKQFYLARPESLGVFFLQGASFLKWSIVSEIDLFSPIPIAGLHGAARAVFVAGMVGAVAGLALALRSRRDWVVASAPVATLVILTGATIGASLLGRYPFGGALRHQFVLFPFVMLTCFGLLDEFLARCHHPRVRRVVLAAACAAVVLNGLAQWKLLHLAHEEPSTEEVANFDRFFDDSDAVYVDQFSLIPFFANHQRDEWSAQRRFGVKFFALPVIEPRRTHLVLRDMTRWSCDLSDPGLYADLHQAIEEGRLASVDLFRLRQDAHLLPPPSRPERKRLADSVTQVAAGEGLHVERLVLDGHDVYARFRLDSGAQRAAPMVIDLLGR